MKRSRQWVVRVRGGAIVAAWLGLTIGSVVVAGLVDSASREPQAYSLRDLLGPEQEPDPQDILDEVHRRQAGDAATDRPGEGPDPLDALARVRARLEREQRARDARVLGAVVTWLLAFGFVAVGTGRWMTAKGVWMRVQSWHGGKLLFLHLVFTTAVFLYAAAASVSSDTPADTTLLITSALLLLAGGVALVRATWNWLTGREARRGAGSPGGHASQRSGAVMSLLRSMRRPGTASLLWLALGLLVGTILGFMISRQPRTYADCVLRGMKHATTATATRALEGACRLKFRPTAQERLRVGIRRPQRPQPPQRPERPRR